MDIEKAKRIVIQELNDAQKHFPSMRSKHEGYAILKEEVEELWEEIKKSKSGVYDLKIEDEAVQVAAMAIRFLLDLC